MIAKRFMKTPEEIRQKEGKLLNMFQEQENERLKLELLCYRQAILQDKEMLGLKQEIKRLNNIINELEKWLKEEYEATVFDYHNAIEDVLNKLKELKGSDKE